MSYSSQMQPNNYNVHQGLVLLEQPLPHWSVVPNGIQPGTLIIVEGQVGFSARSFWLNLYSGFQITPRLKSDGDIAFHFSARFNESCIVRNTLVHGQWGPEERGNGFPLQRNARVVVMILAEETGYKVAINGTHFTDYLHRVPLSSVGIFQIDGDIKINKIEFRMEPKYHPRPNYPPANVPSRPAMPTVPSYAPPAMGMEPVFNPPMPFERPIPGGLRPNMMFYFSGRPSLTPNRFHINLARGVVGHGDIAFHFDVRFPETAVVRNSYQGGLWNNEERHANFFPFQAGVNFDMIVRIESHRFMIAVNGQHFAEFAHRVLPISSVNMLEVGGDVVMSSIRFT